MHKSLFAFTLSGALLAGCASVAMPPPVAVPPQLQPAAGERLLASVPAVGVQIYECRAVKDKPGQYDWAFVAPEADLFDRSGARIGRHYAGPHWEAADGSKVAATVSARAPAPSADAIPWLLLAATSVGGDGRFSKVSAIQRLNTVGGNAPTGGCGATNPGALARIPYSADYVLFARS